MGVGLWMRTTSTLTFTTTFGEEGRGEGIFGIVTIALCMGARDGGIITVTFLLLV